MITNTVGEISLGTIGNDGTLDLLVTGLPFDCTFTNAKIKRGGNPIYLNNGQHIRISGGELQCQISPNAISPSTTKLGYCTLGGTVKMTKQILYLNSLHISSGTYDLTDIAASQPIYGCATTVVDSGVVFVDNGASASVAAGTYSNVGFYKNGNIFQL